MPTPRKADPKPGNHRTGGARGRNVPRQNTKGGVGLSRSTGTAPWDKDVLILQRLELVSKLYHHPTTVIHKAVNKWLEEQGEQPVDIRTIQRDRTRSLELWRQEGVVPNMDDQMAKVLRAEADIWQSIEATPRGPARAGLYVTYLRSVEIQERMAGRWNRPVVEGQAAFGVIPEGPSPFVLYEKGEIPEEAYLGYLETMAKASNQTLGQLPAQAGPVIEGRAKPQEPPEHDSAVTPRPHQMRKDGNIDVDPGVDDWDPTELDR